MVINDAVSIIWQTEYNGTGHFEITVPFTSERFEYLQPDCYVTRTDRTDLGFIEKSAMSYSPDDGSLITVSGKFGIVLLERRIWADLVASSYKCLLNQTLATNAAEAVNGIVDNTLVSPDWTNRIVSWLSIGDASSLLETTAPHESTYQNVFELVSIILNQAMYNGSVSPLGQKVIFDRSSLTATYQLYKGVKRNLIFSQDFNNLLTFNYSFDKELYKTGFLIAGDGEGASRFYTNFGRTADSGEFRREFCFESNKTKTYNDKNGNEQTYSNAKYASVLVNDCKGNFSEFTPLIKIEGTVDLQEYQFGVDYDNGDIITIRDENTRILTPARIWAVTEVQDENGYTITANFEGE